MTPPGRLTSKQRAFAQAIAAGKTHADAYRSAYNPHCSPTTARTEAYRLLKNKRVAAYLASLTLRQEKNQYLTRERKRQILFGIAEDRKIKPYERVKAIEVDNVMTGENAPMQVQVFGLTELLQMVRKKS